MSAHEADHEARRALERQHEALTEQVKLLVKTEHRLHRSQSALDRQLVRIELLSQFALRWDVRSSPRAILVDATRLLRKLFNVDRITAVVGSGTLPDGAVPDAALAYLAPSLAADAVAALPGPTVTSPDLLPPAVRQALGSAGVVRAGDDNTRIVTVIPLRGDGGGVPICIAASSSNGSKSSQLREAPTPAVVPFLRLVASHIEHTLRNARLLDELAQTERQLLHAQQELEARVEIRTRELTREIAERRRAEAALIVARDAAEAASRAKSAFVANMSHELRTPLNAIIGYGELLREETEGLNQGFTADVDRILTSGRHLLRLINNVLDLSKIGAGRMRLDSRPFDLGEVLADVIATTEGLAAANGNRMETLLEDGLGTMTGDRTRVTQVLLNILGNAAKFTERGFIRLSVWRRRQPHGADTVVFRVEDTGIGMTAQELAHAFDEFIQADTSATRRYGGTGLGLTISRTLCRLMGGEIEAHSMPRVGSVFTITLPVVLELSEPDSRTEVRAPLSDRHDLDL